MNYSEKLKEKETKLITLRAQALAKKQSVEDMLEKRNKAEIEVMSLFNIPLAEVPNKLIEYQTQLKEISEKLNQDVDEIESEFAKIKC